MLKLLGNIDLCIIPCIAKSKKPSVPWKNYQQAKYTGVIDPNGNTAVICGKVSNNLVVIDIDSPDLADIIFKDFEGVKKNTLVVKTGSGGYHVYMYNTGTPIQIKRINDKEGRHIDIQSDGAYVIGPGSIHPNGNPYEIISSTEKIDSTDVSKFVESLAAFGFDVKGSGLREVSKIATEGSTSGSRNSDGFKYAAHLLGTLKMDEKTAWMELTKWNRTLCKPPLPVSELKLLFASAVKKIGTKWIGKVIEEQEEVEASKRLFKEISSKDEGEFIEFQSIVLGLDDHKTVTVKSDVQCPKCGGVQEVVGTGYDNPLMPICEECKIRCIEIENTRETIDVRIILLEELPEEVTNNTPVRFTGKVKGHDVKTIKINTRYNFTGRFTSMTSIHNKRINDITLQLFKCITLEEPEGTCMGAELESAVTEKIREDGLKPIYSCIAPYLLGLSVGHFVPDSVLVDTYTKSVIISDNYFTLP